MPLSVLPLKVSRRNKPPRARLSSRSESTSTESPANEPLTPPPPVPFEPENEMTELVTVGREARVVIEL